jgi:hypothetical protein
MARSIFFQDHLFSLFNIPGQSTVCLTMIQGLENGGFPWLGISISRLVGNSNIKFSQVAFSMQRVLSCLITIILSVI